jgi:hypothetical protein
LRLRLRSIRRAVEEVAGLAVVEEVAAELVALEAPAPGVEAARVEERLEVVEARRRVEERLEVVEARRRAEERLEVVEARPRAAAVAGLGELDLAGIAEIQPYKIRTRNRDRLSRNFRKALRTTSK